MRTARQDITEKRFEIGATIVREATGILKERYVEECEESGGVPPSDNWKPTPEALLAFIENVNDVFYEHCVLPRAMLKH